MTPSTNSASVDTSAQADPIAIRRQAAIFLIIEFLLIFAPLIILGAAINWPASLDEPASVNLPLILEQYMAMMTGYSIYLVYSLLFWPMAYLTGRAIVIDDTSEYTFPCGQRVCRPFYPGACTGDRALVVCHAGAGTPLHQPCGIREF